MPHILNNGMLKVKILEDILLFPFEDDLNII